MRVRPSRPDDLPAIQAIYALEVREGTASFELEPPDLAETGRRRDAVLLQGLPHLVADIDGRVAGFAYAAPYRPRPAYRFAVEVSVYVDAAHRRQGVGGALLDALIDHCTSAGARQMVAIIGDSAHRASIALHASRGFRMVGTLTDVGFKHGRWLDTVLMQRPLGPGAATPPEGTT